MSSSKAGFTLIEFLVAIVILMVGLLALLQMVNVAIKHNMGNQLRAEAVSLADEMMAQETAKPFDSIAIATVNYSSSRRINNAFRMYSATKTGSTISANTKNVQIVVFWRYKGARLTQQVSTMISKALQ